MSEILEYLSNVREAEDLAIQLAKNIGSKHKITLFKTYQNAFSHKDAVAWIITEKSLTKSKAEQKVKDLLKFNSIHVASESKKKDDILYYVDTQVLKKACAVEPQQPSRKSEMRGKSVRNSHLQIQQLSQHQSQCLPQYQPQHLSRVSRSLSQGEPTEAERAQFGADQLKTQLEIGLLMFMRSYVPTNESTLEKELEKIDIWKEVAKKRAKNKSKDLKDENIVEYFPSVNEVYEDPLDSDALALIEQMKQNLSILSESNVIADPVISTPNPELQSIMKRRSITGSQLPLAIDDTETIIDIYQYIRQNPALQTDNGVEPREEAKLKEKKKQKKERESIRVPKENRDDKTKSHRPRKDDEAKKKKKIKKRKSRYVENEDFSNQLNDLLKNPAIVGDIVDNEKNVDSNDYYKSPIGSPQEISPLQSPSDSGLLSPIGSPELMSSPFSSPIMSPVGLSPQLSPIASPLSMSPPSRKAIHSVIDLSHFERLPPARKSSSPQLPNNEEIRSFIQQYKALDKSDINETRSFQRKLLAFLRLQKSQKRLSLHDNDTDSGTAELWDIAHKVLSEDTVNEDSPVIPRNRSQSKVAFKDDTDLEILSIGFSAMHPDHSLERAASKDDLDLFRQQNISNSSLSTMTDFQNFRKSIREKEQAYLDAKNKDPEKKKMEDKQREELLTSGSVIAGSFIKSLQEEEIRAELVQEEPSKEKQWYYLDIKIKEVLCSEEKSLNNESILLADVGAIYCVISCGFEKIRTSDVIMDTLGSYQWPSGVPSDASFLIDASEDINLFSIAIVASESHITLARVALQFSHEQDLVEVCVPVSSNNSVGVKMRLIASYVHKLEDCALGNLGTLTDVVPFRLKYGDLLLFPTFLSTTKHQYQSRWEHVAIVIELQGKLTMLEVSRETFGLFDLRSRLQQYRRAGSIGIRRLLGTSISKEARTKIADFINHVNEKVKKLDLFERLHILAPGYNSEDLASTFCAELVAAVYRIAGILSPNTQHICADFTVDNLQLEKGATLSTIIELGQRKDIKLKPVNL